MAPAHTRVVTVGHLEIALECSMDARTHDPVHDEVCRIKGPSYPYAGQTRVAGKLASSYGILKMYSRQSSAFGRHKSWIIVPAGIIDQKNIGESYRASPAKCLMCVITIAPAQFQSYYRRCGDGYHGETTSIWIYSFSPSAHKPSI